MVLEFVEDVVGNVEETEEEVVEAVDLVSFITTDGNMLCVTTKVKIEEPLQMSTKRLRPLLV